jgi:long-chain acyl-CoA synthetase
VAVPINAKLHPSEIDYILADSGARACFLSAHLGLCLGVPMQYLIEVGSAEYGELLTAEPLELLACDAADTAWLFYTSGTTGRPKGATMSHGNLLAMSLCYFADVDQHSPWSAILHAAPMSHGSGLYALAHVLKASCHVIPESDGFNAAEVYALIEAWRDSVFFAAPTMVRRLLDHPGDPPTGNLKTIIYGGGPMYLEDLLRGIRRLGPKFAQLYGQGESPMTITALSSGVIADSNHPRWRARVSSVGVAQSAVEVRTVDDTGASLP